MLIAVLVTILLISYFDLRVILQQNHKQDLIFYAVTAFCSMLCCYYYVISKFSASIVNLIFKLTGMQ